MELPQHFIKLTERKVKLSSLDIVPRVFLNWKKNGVIDFEYQELNEENNRLTSRRMYQFNAFEALWLLMVKELRELRISLDTIKELKGFMFDRPMKEAIEVITEEDFNRTKEIISSKNKEVALIVDGVTLKLVSDNMDTYSEELKIFSSRIASLLILMLLYDETPSIHIVKKTSSKDLEFFEFCPILYFEGGKDKNDDSFTIIFNRLASSSLVNIPLRPLLMKFFEDDLLFKHAEEFGFYTDQEKEVLKVFRKGDFEKIIIYKNDNHIIVEKTTNNDVRGERVKNLRRLLGMNQYEHLEVKFRNDKHLLVKNTSKIKINLKQT